MRVAVAIMVGGLCSGCASSLDEVDCSVSADWFSAGDLLADSTHACHDWVAANVGRVGRAGRDSAAIWTRNNDAGTGVLIGSASSLLSGATLEERFTDPGHVRGLALYQPIQPDGLAMRPYARGTFVVYHTAIGPDTTDEFYVAVVDGQLIEPAGTVGGLAQGSLPLHDPMGVTKAESTWSTAELDDSLLVLAVPHEGDFSDELAATVGIVDGVEGELTLEIEGIDGLVGAPAFDRDNRMVGIVMGSDVTGARLLPVQRVVGELRGAFKGLESDDQVAIQRHLESLR
jgi:hypothetical protein